MLNKTNNKLLFVENRQKTIFWEELAIELLKQDYEVYWIVQNHNLEPKVGKVYKISYPSHRDKIENNYDSEIFDYISSTDRMINYFGYNNCHYGHYYKCISNIISDIKPDYIIGESTLFHEIISIAIAKSKNITYLNPVSIAYPPNKFSFFKGGSIDTLGLSGDVLDLTQCSDLIKDISTKAIIPSYIKKAIVANGERNVIDTFSYKLKTLIPYLLGERYNTPSPVKKILKNKQTNRIQKKWDKLCSERKTFSEVEKTILYPLQLQPEANLDVYGNSFRDQTKIVYEISRQLPENWSLLVKPNPKSKYEMSSELFELIKSTKNITPIGPSLTMSEIFSDIDIVITVTGTIAQECFFSDKPLGFFGPSVIEAFLPKSKLRIYSDIKSLISKVESGSYQFSSKNEKIELVKLLANTSYTGLISDPFHDPDCISNENIKRVSQHFLNLFETLENK